MTAFAKEEIIQPDLSKTGFGYTLQKIGGKYKISILYLLALTKLHCAIIKFDGN